MHKLEDPLDCCFSFIDSTNIKMCISGGHISLQRLVYCEHKWVHSLIYQSITAPAGLKIGSFGPKFGRQHDLTLFRKSAWTEIIKKDLQIDGEYYYIFGNSALSLRS